MPENSTGSGGRGIWMSGSIGLSEGRISALVIDCHTYDRSTFRSREEARIANAP
jgi:hypothetical protein